MSKTIYEFRLIFGGVDRWSDADEDRILGVCQDVIPATQQGVAFLDFGREAETLEGALASAIADARKARLPGRIVRVEIESEEPVTT